MHKFVSKLILGTANFGLNYGIANSEKMVNEDVIRVIFHNALIGGITNFDTAQSYGNIEQKLKDFLPNSANVITKINVETEPVFHFDSVQRKVSKSCKHLKTSSLFALLLHNSDVLLGLNGREVAESLLELKDKGFVEKIGVSIYDPEVLEHILPIFRPDIIQVPFNMFDNRILTSKWMERAKSKNDIEIHARSPFLQGLLLLKNYEIPKKFLNSWSDQFENWFLYQSSLNHSPDVIALQFCLQQPLVDKIVVGVDNEKQLDRILKIEKISNFPNVRGLPSSDVNLIDPSNWNRL